MGLFDKLFGRDSAWYVDKCNVNMERKDYGEAMRCNEKSLKLKNVGNAAMKVLEITGFADFLDIEP